MNMHRIPFPYSGNPAGSGACRKPGPNAAGAEPPFKPFAKVVQRKKSWAWLALHNKSLERVPSIIRSIDQKYRPPSLFGEILPAPKLPLYLTREVEPRPERPLDPTWIESAVQFSIHHPWTVAFFIAFCLLLLGIVLGS
jgi:hypothetical protein